MVVCGKDGVISLLRNWRTLMKSFSWKLSIHLSFYTLGSMEKQMFSLSDIFMLLKASKGIKWKLCCPSVRSSVLLGNFNRLSNPSMCYRWWQLMFSSIWKVAYLCSNWLQALGIAPDNIKALFRKGQALVNVKNWEKAEVGVWIYLFREPKAKKLSYSYQVAFHWN